MLKNGLNFAFFIVLILGSTRADASFYSTLDNTEYTYADLLSDFDLVVLTSKDCQACKNLQFQIHKCKMPDNFKVAWVSSQVSKYEFHRNTIEKVKTTEKNIQKLTRVTPKSILRGRSFKEGVFDCKELEKAI